MMTGYGMLNDPPQDFAGPIFLHELIDWGKYMERCALDFRTHSRQQTYTYRELQECIASLVSRIHDILIDGVHQPNSEQQLIVPLLLPQSPSLYISQIAVLQSGAAFCPISLDAPEDRIAFVIKDVGAKLIISTSALKETLPKDCPLVLVVDEIPKPPVPQTKGLSHGGGITSSSKLAYVIYTSGSTGKPKGVGISHQAVTQSLLAHQRHIPAFRRFLQFASPSFDVSVFEIFFPLYRGSTLVGSDRNELLNDLPRVINEQDVDAVELTPTVVGSLLQKRANVPGLKLLMTIGEMLTRPIVEEFGASEGCPGILYGMYGPTEAAIHCTISPNMRDDANPRNIGVPFDTVSIFVAAVERDDQEITSVLDLLPLGGVGELVLAGPQLANGYLHRDAENVSSFVDFAGRRCYRTGDKARLLPDGSIEMLGRVQSGQIKLRGQRVELGEIEAAVYRHPSVQIASAIIIAGVLVAFALASDISLTSSDVLQTCADWLPKYMIPSEIIFLEEFPYLPSGKIDKQQLEAYYSHDLSLDGNGIVSANSTERTVRAAVSEVLGQYASNARLAAAGLDSLSAIRLSKRLRASAYNVTTVAVLQCETLRSLVQLCGQHAPALSLQSIEQPTDLTSVALKGDLKDVESVLPCSPLQNAMLAETAIDPKAYRNWVEFELSINTDRQLVSRTLHRWIDHTPMLRTGFVESRDGHGYSQVVWRSLLSSQFSQVESFNYGFDEERIESFLRPIHFQLLQLEDSIKVLMHIHHALYDAWSLELLLDDLDACLVDQVGKGRGSCYDLALPTDSSPQKDQPTLERPSFKLVVDSYMGSHLLSDKRFTEQYWKDYLYSVVSWPLPNFHYDKPASPGLSVRYLTTTIPTTDVNAAARRLLVSPQSFFQAAFALVLSSYLGTSDFCFGTAFSGRTLPIPGIDDIIGPCITTLPIRVDLSTCITLHDIVRELNTTTRKHLEHSMLPLNKIKAIAGVPPRRPLFDALFIWQQTLHAYDHSRKYVSLVDTTDNLEFNLTLEVIPGLHNVQLKANYQQSLFHASQVEALQRQVEHVALLMMDSNSHKSSSAFENLSPRLLSIENPYPNESMPDLTLVSPVETIAAEDPHRSAVEFARSIRSDGCDMHRLTYSQLNRRANQLSHHLLALGCQPADAVCICLEQSVEFYLSVLATVKIGAILLSVPPDMPAEWLKTIVRDARSKLIVTSTIHRNKFEAQESMAMVYIDDLALENLSTSNIISRSIMDNLAYYIFTSDTTDKPIGVLLTQRNLLSNLSVLQEVYTVSRNTRMLQLSSQVIDVSIFETFFTWRVGGCLCVASKDDLLSDIEHAIRVLDVTHLSLTPTVAGLINPVNIPKVQSLVTAGEVLTPEVLNAWAGKGLHHAYGPSEMTNICTVHSNIMDYHNMNTIGKPLRNTSVFVLSSQTTFEVAPQGGEGELVFGGSQVFQGYLDRRSEDEKIIEHPKYGRLYRSGEFGRMLSDGTLIYTGKKDDQIKIRGQRVELSEINNIIQRDETVTSCSTIVIRSNSDRLVSFWTCKSCESIVSRCLQPDRRTTTRIYHELTACLPSYMIPSALIPVSTLPVNTQGKLDQRKLETMYSELDLDYLNSTAYQTPPISNRKLNARERYIVQALVEVLGISAKDVAPNTSFFTLGLDSLSAISVARYLREKAGMRVQISDVLKHNSTSALAANFESMDHAPERLSGENTQVTDFGFSKTFMNSVEESFNQAGKPVEQILPCTALQEAMLSATKLFKTTAYVNHIIFEVFGNVDRLRECWNEMVERHQILRTCFMSTDLPRHADVQVVLARFEPDWAVVKIDTIENHVIIKHLQDQFVFTEFEPPYSLRVFNTSSGAKLAISIHHALYDGVAMTVLYQEVEKAYYHKTLPPTVSFSSYLQGLLSLDMDAADKFWKNVFAGYTTKPRQLHLSQSNLRDSTTRVHHSLATLPLSWIEEQAKSFDISILAIFQAVWAAIASEIQQDLDICFGNVVSGRHTLLDGFDQLVAPCFNTIPLRLQQTHQLSYLEAMRKLHLLNTSSLPFHMTSLRRIQSKIRSDGSRLFETLFILQHSTRSLDASIWSISEDYGNMDIPLIFEIIPKHSNDTLDFVLHSNSYSSSHEAAMLLSQFEFKLREALEDPRRSLLSPSIKEKMLSEHEIYLPSEQSLDQLADAPVELTATELIVRDVMSDFTDLELRKITRTMSIFKLGLDSINAVQVASRLKSKGYDIRASDVLQHPTISQLAIYLENLSTGVIGEISAFSFDVFDQRHRSAISKRYSIASSSIEAVRPCTPVQQGMIAQSLHSEMEEYWNSTHLELESQIALLDIEEAWKMVMHQHEMLRTGFVEVEDTKYPFAMVTFCESDHNLPWYEEDVPDCKDLLRPWYLKIVKGAQICIQFHGHHAVYDAQSMQMILSDVAKHFHSKTIVSRPRMTPLLQDILLASEADSQSKLFWEDEGKRLVSNRFPELTPLHVHDRTFFTCEKILAISLKVLEEGCRRYDITAQTATQTTWARLLSAYTGEPQVTFATTLSGRSIHPDATETPFPTIVTLPVNCIITASISDMLSRSMRLNIELFKYQFTPLASIQKYSGHTNTKLFDTLFVYQKLTTEADESDRPWKLIKEEARVEYDVSIEVQALPSGEIMLRLSSTKNIIPEAHARLMVDQYDALLSETLQNPPDSSNNTLNLHSELLSITPAKDTQIESHVNLLHEFVELGAVRWPHKTALEFTTDLKDEMLQRRSWTYAELDQQSNMVAQLLIHHDVIPGQIVAICFEKCAQASFAIIGILKAGCAYVALDPGAPDDRLAFIMEDSDARLILTAGVPAQRLNGALGATIVDLSTSNLFNHYSSKIPQLARQILSQDICYCLYTSGTTGLPKGCLISHESAVQAMLSFQRLFAGRWNEKSKWLQFASFHFDVSVLEQFWSWSVGICVASAPRDLIFEDIPRAITQLGITHIDLTPSLAQLVHPDEVPALCEGVFITGGEQLKQEILDDWGDKLCIFNGYGPTEATIGVTMYCRVPKNGKPANIGPQFDNVGSYVLLPDTGYPVLKGAVGELAVSGKLLGQGYLNRPDLTAEKFPTLDTYGERVYRTGDLVRILHDGSFLFIGRADDQVKLRGQRLELGEINSVIKKAHNNVREVVTLVLKHKDQRSEQLVCFLVASSKNLDVVPVIKSACKSRLPGYMIPTYFLLIDAIPLNVNNKADSKQLDAMYNEMSHDQLRNLDKRQRPQWNEDELRIIERITTYLDADDKAIRRDTSLFELGLDSITIIGFAYALQKAGFENARLSVVKNNPVVSDLTEALLGGRPNTSREAAYLLAKQQTAVFAQKHSISICKDLGIEISQVEALSPATPLQQGMIYRFLEAEDPVYFLKFSYKLYEHIDSEKLMSAWDQVVMNLQILRTKFVATDDGYAQVALKTMDSRQSVDYTTIDKDLALANPWSINLLESSDGRIVSLRIFHGIYDGNSLDLTFRCLFQSYNGDPPDYGPSFQSILCYGPLIIIPDAEVFWKDHLRTWEYHHLAPPVRKSQTIEAKMVMNDMRGFDLLRRKIGVTPQALVQAVWLVTIRALLTENLTIGLVNSGRSIDFEGAERVIGPLFNTVPFHIKIGHGIDMSAFILKCHQVNQEMQNFQQTSLKDIQRWIGVQPGQNIFQSLFLFQRSDIETARLERNVWHQVEEELAISDYPLAFEATLSEDSRQLSLLFIAPESILTQWDADEILDRFNQLLQVTLDDSGNNMIPAISRFGNSADMSSAAARLYDSAKTSVGPKVIPVQRFYWTTTAQQIRQHVSTLADISDEMIDEHTSIYEVGLDSIDIIKLSSRLKKGGIEIPVSSITRCQTIALMHKHVKVPSPFKDTMKNKAALKLSKQILASIDRKQLPVELEDVLPATPLQQTMFNEMMNSDFRRYFTIEASEIKEAVDINRLARAIKAVVAQSSILRTSFIKVSDPKVAVSYAQVVHAKWDDIRNLRDQTELQDIVDSIKNEVLTKQSLFKVRFATIHRCQHMIIAISHALYDGTSWRALHEDIADAYQGILRSRPDPMPFLEQALASITVEAEKFWRYALADLPSTRLPRKSATSDSDNVEVYRLDRRSKVSLDEIEALCKRARISLQTLGQTCWAFVLAELMRQLDVVFCSVLSCRDTEEAAQCMFPLMNTIAVRAVLHGNVKDMFRYMQGMSDATRAYQHYPLGKAQAIASAAKAEQSANQQISLSDSLFIYQGRRQPQEDGSLYKSVYGSSDVEIPICVEMEVVNDIMNWKIACKSSVRNRKETAEILVKLDFVLQRVLALPDSQIIDLDSAGISVCGLPRFQIAEKATHPMHVERSFSDDQWSEAETSIRRALHNLSKVPEQSIFKDSTIFHLGLDSISILKLPDLLRRSDIKLSVSNVLEHLTIRGMAEYLKQNERRTATPQLTDGADAVPAKFELSVDVSQAFTKMMIKAEDIAYVLPVTAGQLYAIKRWQESGGSLFYYCFEYDMKDVNMLRIREAWSKLVQRHDILRTAFIEIHSRIFQFAYKEAPSVVSTVHHGIPKQETHETRDLSQPPLRLYLEEGAKSTKLFFQIHHALYDGVSLPNLIKELETLYHGKALEAMDLSFKHFVARAIAADQQTQGESNDQIRRTTQELWTSYLQSQPSLLLQRPLKVRRRIEVFQPSLSIPSLNSRARAEGVSTDSLLLAAVSKSLAAHLQTCNAAPASTSAITIGIYLANRAPFGQDLSSLAGPTLNILPLRIQEPSVSRIEEISQEIRKDLLKITSQEMVFASLMDIYRWTGVRVNFCVNILKASQGNSELSSDETMFHQVKDMRKKAEEVEVKVDEDIKASWTNFQDAYMPTVDMEIRYHDSDGRGSLDIGLFGPSNLLSVFEAEKMIASIRAEL